MAKNRLPTAASATEQAAEAVAQATALHDSRLTVVTMAVVVRPRAGILVGTASATTATIARRALAPARRAVVDTARLVYVVEFVHMCFLRILPVYARANKTFAVLTDRLTK